EALHQFLSRLGDITDGLFRVVVTVQFLDQLTDFGGRRAFLIECDDHIF
ncbi:MAG: hypothetical protein FD179_1707, partial [Erysipelotrichaceae bacterium]